MTTCGFWLDAAESRNTNGFPRTMRFNNGKASRILTTSNRAELSVTERADFNGLFMMTRFDFLIQVVSDGFVRALVQNFSDKCALQQC